MSIYIEGWSLEDWENLLRQARIGANNAMIGELTVVRELPPHGLIDREQILDAIRLELAQANACNDMDDYDAWMRVFDYVRKFHTIIPAEEAPP